MPRRIRDRLLRGKRGRQGSKRRHIAGQSSTVAQVKEAYREALKDFKKYRKEATKECMNRCPSIEKIPDGEAFPKGHPPVYIAEIRWKGAPYQGVTYCEELDGHKCTITVGPEESENYYKTCLHEFSHVWGIHHEMSLEESAVRCITTKIISLSGED